MYKVQEMAENRKAVKDRLISYRTKEMIEHLIRLIIFNSPKNKNHWRGEVYGLLNDIPLMKHNKKPPNRNFIFQTIWEYYGDRLDYLTESVLRQEPKEKLKTDKKISDFADEIYIKVKDYVFWLSKELSEKAVVTKQEVYNKLEELEL